MTKSILAYFKSENDAESARIRLQSLRVDKLYLDHIPEEDNEFTFIPVIPMSSGSFSPGATTIPEADFQPSEFDNNDRMTHLIEGEVKEADYEKAMKIIHEANGYQASS